ncbi:MAG: gamma-glutamyl-gamma-aminobutyrate hydrolase family protein [Bacteroidales bacterium]|nr:gamma-glutamyl-gamma-aminobutyrate hydrolase family protein [Bacteroidales bacterium]
MRRTFNILTVILLLIVSACQQQTAREVLQIAISKAGPGEHYQYYGKFLKRADSTIITRNMSTLSLDSAINALKASDGLLVTGGPDVYPGWYGQEKDTAKCGSFNRRRDTLELSLIKTALKEGIPILGICRGEQILNVHLGGTLLIDIPTDFGKQVLHRTPEGPTNHLVRTTEDSHLISITHDPSEEVNSNHHQAVDMLAPSLKVGAYSPDSLIEAIEWKQPKGHPFLLGVQWHPERLPEDNTFSTCIARAFVEAVESYSNK